MLLPNWYWWLFSSTVEPYRPERVNPTSYDLSLDDRVILQVYHGQYLNQRGIVQGRWIYLDNGDRVPNHFLPGDSVLASTFEVVRVPRFVRLQGMLKSSVAREGLDHRSALYIDPGFHGPITLELRFDVPGSLVPFMPIIQVEAHLALTPSKYSGRYNGQSRPQPNLNPDIAFKACVPKPYTPNASLTESTTLASKE